MDSVFALHVTATAQTMYIDFQGEASIHFIFMLSIDMHKKPEYAWLTRNFMILCKGDIIQSHSKEGGF